jgi:branched-chain amino acid transport system substrate-binding protein
LKQKSRFALTAVVAGSLILAACGSSSKGTSSATTAAGSSATTAGTGSAGTTGGSAGNTASDTGVTPTTIKIGYITSFTGVSDAGFSDGFGAAQARVDVLNNAGGVNGRKIQLVKVDDESTPAGDLAAAQNLVAQHVFGVIDYSAFTFGGYKVLQQAGIPVTGYAFDGPEWGVEPNSNMFSFLPPYSTAWSGKYYYPNWTGKFLAAIGSKKPAGFAYGVSPSSQASIKVIYQGAAENGLSNCYANYSVPFGGVDFTADVLQVKAAGCDSVIGSFVDSSDQALATAVTQAGLTNVKKLWYTGYDSNTVSTAATKAAYEGSYFENTVIWDHSNPPVGAMLDNLAKYDPGFLPTSIPDFGTWGSYLAADLMIQGLQGAGQNPTRKTFISNLRQVTNYSAGGILPSPTSFANFGTPQMIPATNCQNFVQLKNGQFVNADPGGKPVCASTVTFPAG